MSFAYRWLRCPTSGGVSDGSNCAPIGGSAGAGSTYRLRDADVGIRIRVRVTASNADGSDTAVSNPTAIVQGSARPRNIVPPSISGSPVVGATQTADPGVWSGTQPITFTYQWRSCNSSGGGCSAITGSTARDLRGPAGGRRQDAARTRDGNQRDRHRRAGLGPDGCHHRRAGHRLPEWRWADQHRPAHTAGTSAGRPFQVSPNPIPLSTGGLTVRFHVTACGGRNVAGALVYVTAVPYNQFSIPSEQQTGGDGWVTMQMDRLGGFPAANNQSLLVMFVRARKGTEPVLAGVSTRRLISFQLTRSARFTARTVGSSRVTAAPTSTVAAAACPAGNGPIQVNQATPPARLLVDRFQVVPNPVPRTTDGLTVRFHVTACGGRDVARRARVRHGRAVQPVRDPARGADGWRRLGDNADGPAVRLPGGQQPEPARDVRPRSQGRRANPRGHLDAASDLVQAREVGPGSAG